MLKESMKALVIGLIAVWLPLALGQSSAKEAGYFRPMDEALGQDPKAGWYKDRTELAKIFAKVRTKAGADFRTALAGWVGSDPRRHYWASAFLCCKDHLYGGTADLEFGLLLLVEGVECAGSDGEIEVPTRIAGAALAQRLGLKALAAAYKAKAEQMIRTDPVLKWSRPALEDEGDAAYDEIPLGQALPSTTGPADPVKPVPATQAEASFSELQKAVGLDGAGWAGDKRKLSDLFAKERRRLGDAFPAALMKFVAGDAKRHFWASAFLTVQEYLHGEPPKPQLGLLLLADGLACSNLTEDDGLTIRAVASVQAYRLGLMSLASANKSWVEKAIREDPRRKYAFPALDSEESQIYEKIK